VRTKAKVKLGACVDLVAGLAFKSQHFTDNVDDVALVKGENVSQGRVLWEISKRWPAAEWERLTRFHLVAGDVVVAMDRPWVPAGLKWAVIRDGDPKALLVQRVARLRTKNNMDQEFLRYVIGGPDFEAYVKPITSGVNVPHISGRQILDFEFALPPLAVQRRVARVLSAYDDLIENNRRRIQILEQMARALYREWFVEFRFPSHEPTNRVPSPIGRIPADWPIIDLQTVCIGKNGIQTGPFGSQLHQSDYSEDGLPVVMPKDLIGFRINSRSVARVPELVAEKLSRYRVQPGDILYGRRGDIGRRAYVMPHQAQWLCGTGCLRLRPDRGKVDGWYLFHHLGRDEVLALIAGRAHGATLPNLNTQLMASVPVLVPPKEIQRRYRELTMPMAESCETLIAQSHILRRTRDLLLPRLLSGQITLAEAAA
jgi:type I restriction enzyme S subunit